MNPELPDVSARIVAQEGAEQGSPGVVFSFFDGMDRRLDTVLLAVVLFSSLLFAQDESGLPSVRLRHVLARAEMVPTGKVLKVQRNSDGTEVLRILVVNCLKGNCFQQVPGITYLSIRRADQPIAWQPKPAHRYFLPLCRPPQGNGMLQICDENAVFEVFRTHDNPNDPVGFAAPDDVVYPVGSGYDVYDGMVLMPGFSNEVMALSQPPPGGLSITAVLNLLGNHVPSSQVQRVVWENGVCFALNEETEKLLSAAGAEGDVLEAMRQAYKPTDDSKLRPDCPAPVIP